MSSMLLPHSLSLRTLPKAARLYSTTPTAKPSVKLIAELRKQTDVSLPLAREALAASKLSIPAALQWLAKRGDKKASKVEGRATNEGLVGVYAISSGAGARMRAPVWAGMVEMNCETDFVARGELFGKLLSEVSHSAAFHVEAIRQREKAKKGPQLITTLDVDELMESPLMSYTASSVTGKKLATVGQALRSLMGKVGENVSIRRAAVVKHDLVARKDVGLRLGAYGHGGIYTEPKFHSGRIASMAVLALKAPLDENPRSSICDWFRKNAFTEDMQQLEAALARQIAGFPTTSVVSDVAGDEGALYNQQFLMYPPSQGASVADVLAAFAQKHRLVKEGTETGLEVVEFLKWTVGGESVAGKKA